VSSEIGELERSWRGLEQDLEKHLEFCAKLLSASMRCARCGHPRSCHERGLVEDHAFVDGRQFWLESRVAEEAR